MTNFCNFFLTEATVYNKHYKLLFFKPYYQQSIFDRRNAFYEALTPSLANRMWNIYFGATLDEIFAAPIRAFYSLRILLSCLILNFPIQLKFMCQRLSVLIYKLSNCGIKVNIKKTFCLSSTI